MARMVERRDSRGGVMEMEMVDLSREERLLSEYEEQELRWI